MSSADLVSSVKDIDKEPVDLPWQDIHRCEAAINPQNEAAISPQNEAIDIKVAIHEEADNCK